MKTKLLAFIFMFMVSNLLAKNETTPSANFGGGLNIKTIASEIDDAESPDMSNMINDLYGASFKRNGSKRSIDQAFSSNPVNSIFRFYQSTGTEFRKNLFVATGKNVVRSTSDAGPRWLIVDTATVHNQHYSFTPFGNRIIWTGDGLVDPIRRYDVVTDSLTNLLTDTTTVILRAKYSLSARNYLLLGNVVDVTLTNNTTSYPSRVYYSLLAAPTAYTVTRYIEVKTDDGEQIQGLSEMNGFVHFWKETSIHELDFTILDPGTIGDQVLRHKVSGFGLLVPRTLVNTGDYYIFLAKDGIRVWDGGRRSRLTSTEESRVISTKIEPIINEIISNGVYGNCHAIYYPKRQWYVFAYEDVKKSPKGVANSVLIYDLVTGNWFPFNNWIAQSFGTMDGFGDKGELLYGSNDGYVHLADVGTSANDSRKELVVDVMDSTAAGSSVLWARGTQDITNVREGTASVRLGTLSSSVSISSITRMGILNFGEWYDKSRVTKDDKISFKVYVSSIQNIDKIRVDLEVNDAANDFDNNFTSVTLSSSALIAGNTAWTTIEIAISSFVILDTWTALDTETLPFANTLTFYGIRFVSTGVGDAFISVDDLRLAQATENPLNAYRYSKQWNFGSPDPKKFDRLILNTEVSADSEFFIDIFNNFGEFSNRANVRGDFSKELYVSGYNENENITKLNSVDFSVHDSTSTTNQSYFAARPLVVDKDHIFAGDQFNNRILKILKSSVTDNTFVSTYGALGSGTTNFNLIYQMAVDDRDLYVCDFANNRVKVHRKSNLEFVFQFGSLGQNTTSFHNPTGIAVDERYVYIGQDGNYRIQKLTKSTFGYVTSIELNLNTIGDITLSVDEKYLYNAYNSLSPSSIENQDVIFEKRNKSDLSLVNKITIRPSGVSSLSLSTYTLQGDLGISDDYIYISFTDDTNGNGNYYIQKRLKSDFSLVREYKSNRRHFAVSHNGLSYKPLRKTVESFLGIDGTYMQLRYWESGLDNNMKLFNQAFKLTPHESR